MEERNEGGLVDPKGGAGTDKLERVSLWDNFGLTRARTGTLPERGERCVRERRVVPDDRVEMWDVVGVCQ